MWAYRDDRRVDTGTKRNGAMKPEFEERVALDVDDILQASDEEILAEFTESHGDPAKNAADMRALFERTVLATNKRRLKAPLGDGCATQKDL
jgi:hypothetical protein